MKLEKLLFELMIWLVTQGFSVVLIPLVHEKKLTRLWKQFHLYIAPDSTVKQLCFLMVYVTVDNKLVDLSRKKLYRYREKKLYREKKMYPKTCLWPGGRTSPLFFWITPTFQYLRLLENNGISLQKNSPRMQFHVHVTSLQVQIHVHNACK